MPRITVVLPTYNRAHCLDRAVRSIAAQDYPDWELILVDDGSTDETVLLRRRFAALLGSRYRDATIARSGVSAARNHGVAMASGELIAFLDSDDFWLPQKLGMQVAALEQNPSTGFCFTDYAEFRDDGNFSLERHTIGPALEGHIYPAVLEIRHNVITSPSVVVRRDILAQTGGFDEGMQVCEDIDLWRRVSRRTCCVPVRVPLVAVRTRSAEAYPYRVNLAARLSLYRKACREDPDLPPSFVAKLYTEMLTAYREVALLRRDEKFSAVMRSALAAARRAGTSVYELEQVIARAIE